MKARRLGRGLTGLIGSTTPEATQAPPARAPAVPPAPPRVPVPGPTAAPAPAGATVGGAAVRQQLPVGEIQPNPYQPRRVFGEEELAELQASIAEHGLLQPIVVRVAAVGYEVIAGERRLRAVQALGQPTIAAVLRQADDREMQTLALIENIQRVDLNAMEKARALRSMMTLGSLRQEDVADRVGKARATVANLLRLLELPSEVQELVEQGLLSGAHARAVLQAKGTERRIKLGQQAAAQGWSVRETERRAAEGPTAVPRRTASKDPYVADLEERIRRALSAPAALKPKGKGGVITLRYHDADDLDRLLERFGA